MKDLLFISPTSPLPLDSGMRVRIFNLLQACCVNFRVTFVGPKFDSSEDKKTISKLCPNIIEVASSINSSTYSRLKYSLLTFEIMSSERCSVIAAYRDAIDATLDLSKFARIWVERRDLLYALHGYRPRTIVDLDDLEYKKKYREAVLRPTTVGTIRGLPRVMGLLLGETVGVRSTKAAIVCSDNDVRSLRRLGVRNALAVPNGTNISATTYQERRPKAVFVGNMSYYANSDAVSYFDSKIAPLIRQFYPNFELDVIGALGSETFSGSVRMLGFVQDLESALLNYRISVAPLRFGGGTKLKLIDAMASGTAIVSTSVGAEGIPLVNRESALIADSPEAFAASVIELMNNPSLAEALANKASAIAHNLYSWDKIRSDVTAWL